MPLPKYYDVLEFGEISEYQQFIYDSIIDGTLQDIMFHGSKIDLMRKIKKYTVDHRVDFILRTDIDKFSLDYIILKRIYSDRIDYNRRYIHKKFLKKEEEDATQRLLQCDAV